jgi:hypothetical protein
VSRQREKVRRRETKGLLRNGDLSARHASI